jgi:hypothetical protein
MECGEKIRHTTRDEALEHQKKLVFRNHVDGRDERSMGLSVYPCSHCGQWHVGHQRSLPLVWHYTFADKLEPIVTSGVLRPPAPRAVFSPLEAFFTPQTFADLQTRYPDGTVPLSRSFLNTHRSPLPRLVRVRIPQTNLTARIPREWIELRPLLWFSRNATWEYSICGRQVGELQRGGLLRFGVPSSMAKLRWSDYLERNLTPSDVRDTFASRGYPPEWLATDETISLNDVSIVQVYHRERWTPVDEIADEEFERYLAERPVVYEAARVTLQTKISAGTHSTIMLVGSELRSSNREPLPSFAEAERIVLEDAAWDSSRGEQRERNRLARENAADKAS